MPLKSFQNGADKDSLFSYVNRDPLLKRLLTRQPDEKPKPEKEPKKFYVNGKLLTRSEFEARKRRRNY
jgi:hypothetical protein